MASLFKNNLLIIVGVLLGMTGGFLYWKYIGCASGTCYIQSSLFNMTAYGAVMGGLFTHLFQSQSKNGKQR